MENITLNIHDGIYTCDIGISVEEWVEILKNPDVTSQNARDMLIRFYCEPDHKATCTAIAQKYDLTTSSVNSTVTQFGIAVKKHLNRFEVKDENGADDERFWCIPIGRGEYVDSLFEWTLRPELAEAIKRTHLTWVPFYNELAEKLLQYKDNRGPLLDIILSLPDEHIAYLKEYDGKPIKDIEPFSLFAIFNRGITESKKKDICTRLKKALGISVDIPSDFDGIPIVNNQLSYFFDVPTGGGCDELWELFVAAMNDKEDLSEEFAKARRQHGVKWNVTMFLYWVCPDKYLPLDATTRIFLEKNGVRIFKEKDLDWAHYSELQKKVEEKYPGVRKPSISYYAWSIAKTDPYVVLFEEYRKLVDKDKARAIGNEIYKWNLLSDCQEKSEVESALMISKCNVINQRQDTQVLTGLAKNSPEGFTAAIAELLNEDKDLNERLAQFRTAMGGLCEAVFPGKKLGSTASDERVASAFLACRYPETYTFYKDSYYGRLCTRVGVKTEQAGHKYKHYMELIQPLADIVSEAEDIRGLFKDKFDSDLLIAQNILYVMTNESVIKGEIIQALNNSEQFVYVKKDRKNDQFVWVGDKDGIIGNNDCHYEFLYTGSEKYGHQPQKVYVEAHFENPATASIFGETVRHLSEKDEKVIPFKWNRKCCDSIRINNEGYDLYSSSLTDDIMYELAELDNIVGPALRYTFKTMNANKAIMEKNRPLINLLKSKKQIILQGAPGTGKTYRTAEIAVEMCDGTIPSTRDELMARYRQLSDEGRIGFTTFHQSMDYEEFIEGIKPYIGEGESGISYKTEPGIFLKMCQKASEPIVEEGSLQIKGSSTVWKVSLGGTYENPIRTDCLKNGYIRIGWDVYGDFQDDDIEYTQGGKYVLDAFRNKMQIGDIVFSCYSSKEIDAIGVVTGEYEYNDNFSDHKRLRKVQWLVKGVKENILELNGGTTMTLSTVYKLNAITIDKVMQLLEKHKAGTGSSVKENDKPYILVIDEINRGNISKIFGELITLLEADKRKGSVNALSASLTYSKMPFSVPSNLYIIGTMNTADRSIGYVDYAVRRRFSFYTLTADKSVIENYYLDAVLGKKAIDLFGKVEELINDKISPEFSPEDLMVGHSYFLASDEEELMRKFEYEIKPLLYEYANDGILINLKRKEGKYPAIEEIGL